MILLLRVTYYSAAALSLFAASMVMLSLFMPERAPHSIQFWIITIGIGMFLAAIGLALLGVGRHLPAIGILGRSMAGDDGVELRRRWGQLAAYLLLGGLLVIPLLLLIAWGILARIDEGFALFG